MIDKHKYMYISYSLELLDVLEIEPIQDIPISHFKQ